MLKFGSLVFISILYSTTTSFSQAFSCPVTGGPQSAFKVSKGKIGNYKAKIVGKNIVVSIPEGKLIIKANRRASFNGQSQGKLQCDMDKVRRVIANG